MRHARLGARELADEGVDVALDDGRHRLFVGLLGPGIGVAPPADDEAAVRQLVPVVEAAARVVRRLESPCGERLGRDDLPSRRLDDHVELGHQPARVAVGRDDDGVGTRVLEPLEPVTFDELGAGLGREARDTIARLLHSADIQLPKAFSLSGVRVSTKKKLQSERRLQ